MVEYLQGHLGVTLPLGHPGQHEPIAEGCEFPSSFSTSGDSNIHWRIKLRKHGMGVALCATASSVAVWSN